MAVLRTPTMKKLFLTLSFLSLALLCGQAAEATWRNDFATALADARREAKVVLIDFTGSDWCGWCIKMKKDTLDQKAFLEFAARKLVLVEADFPNKKALPDAVKKQNQGLQKKYSVGGYPTFVLVDADGKELGRQVGYLKGGPEAFMAKIEGWMGAKAAPGAK